MSKCPSFRYPGGKAKFAIQLVKYMPKSGRKFIDVFGGRGNILFRAIHEGLDYREWIINDIARAPFFRAIKKHGDTFRATEKTKKEFYRLKELAKDGDPTALIMEPWLTWSGSIYTRSGPTTRGGMKTAAHYQENVRLACQYLRDKDVKITQLDWLDCLEAEGLGEQDFVMCDPPYCGVDVCAYSCDSLSHLELVSYLKGARHPWLLNESPEPLYISAFGEPILQRRMQLRITDFRKHQGWRMECLWSSNKKGRVTL